MDSIEAFARGQASRNNPLMVFDWDKAARIIIENNAKEASAGLSNDWEWTGGDILKDGKPVKAEDTYTYLASRWAIPELEINGFVQDCYRAASETDGWDAETFWPESALAIFNQEKQPT